MHCYRVSKYDPSFRINGVYVKDEWTSFSDIGKNFEDGILSFEEYMKWEDKYKAFIKAVLEKCCVDRIQIKGLEQYGNCMWKEGQILSDIQIMDFLQNCLREECWAKLKSPKILIYVGYDYYIHLNVAMSREDISSLSSKYGLYVENE